MSKEDAASTFDHSPIWRMISLGQLITQLPWLSNSRKMGALSIIEQDPSPAWGERVGDRRRRVKGQQPMKTRFGSPRSIADSPKATRAHGCS